MYRITYALELFDGRDLEQSHAALNIMLRNLAELDALWLRRHPEAPWLYQSGVHYKEEPPGQEDWQDIPTCLRMGIGDCLPISTLVLREGSGLFPIGLLSVGDRILSDDGFTTVRECASTGSKTVLHIDLDNGRRLTCTPEHKLLDADGCEIPASDVKVRDRLLTPRKPFRFAGEYPFFNGLPVPSDFEGRIRVSAISRAPEPVLCADITTDSGRFYLPESDLLVHNCEDLACWRAAELRVRMNIAADPIFTHKLRADGGSLYHILVRYPDGRIEDPSKILGMR